MRFSFMLTELMTVLKTSTLSNESCNNIALTISAVIYPRSPRIMSAALFSLLRPQPLSPFISPFALVKLYFLFFRLRCQSRHRFEVSISVKSDESEARLHRPRNRHWRWGSEWKEAKPNEAEGNWEAGGNKDLGLNGKIMEWGLNGKIMGWMPWMMAMDEHRNGRRVNK